ncbi:MAG: hypothetical protein J6W54_05420 [Fibrobacter sp.]|uniref:portal protein n=1 Tax=Fibrobacter sp. TaxID=35828 RepID=UPI001B0C3D13|nr:portal protein [Fibrobacter sp.]MBO7060521.1 hypothetical protein [Fibrobacter sp.]
MGFLNLSIDYDKDGNAVPVLYSIPDVTKVYYDPDSIEIDGSDANQAIIIDIKSKAWIKKTYGENFVTEKGDKPLIDISESYDEQSMPLITYYVRSNGGVTVYKLLNKDLLEDPITLNIDRLPIIPVYGEEIFVDDKLSHRGIVSQSKPIQKLIDYSYSQLCERLAKSPKNALIITKEALEGNDEYYKNFDKSINQVLPYNKYDDRKDKNEPPTRIDMTIQYNDLTTVLQNSLAMLQSITGVESIGIPDQKVEMTATEALLNAKTYTNNVRNYFDNLKESFKSAGHIFFQLLGYDVEVSVEQGPEDQMERQVARAELIQLAQLVPDDKRMDLVGAITATLDDNQFIRRFNQAVFGGVSPEVMRLQQQLQQQQLQFQNQIQQMAQAYQELKNQNQQLNVQLVAMEQNNRNALVVAQMDNQTELQKEAMRLQAQSENQDAERATELQKEAFRQNNENARLVAKIEQKNNEQIINQLGA